jgi:hypothetical protein
MAMNASGAINVILAKTKIIVFLYQELSTIAK